LVNVLGFDIGGANTKAALLKTQGEEVKHLKTRIQYFPVWKRGKEQLPEILKKLRSALAASELLDAVAVTITAELSDAYQTKREGINHVVDCVEQVFIDEPVFVLNVDADLVSVEEARKQPLNVASANWAATGWMVSKLLNDCILVDVGSTSTSIIPVVDGRVAAEGRTDLEKLQNGELVYSGALRTNVAAIVNRIPVWGRMTRVSSELFAQSGDVHLILGNISEAEYTAETCDGRGKSREEAMARLARVVCADTEMLDEQEVVQMARFVCERQVEQIAEGIKQVYVRFKPQLQGEVCVVVTGLGRACLARRATEKAGLEKIVGLDELVGDDAAVVSPSVGVALMAASRLEGKTVKWKRS